MKYQLEKPVQGLIAKKKYQCSIEWRNGKFLADEPQKGFKRNTGRQLTNGKS